MTQSRAFVRLVVTLLISSALLLTGCGRGADESVSGTGSSADDASSRSADSVVGTDGSDASADDPDSAEDSASGESATGESAQDDTDADADGTSSVLTGDDVDLDKVEAELEAIERELDSLAFPEDSVFDDASGALF